MQLAVFRVNASRTEFRSTAIVATSCVFQTPVLFGSLLRTISNTMPILHRRPSPGHYLIVGHDIYHQVVAGEFTAVTVPKRSIRDPRLLALIAAD